MNLLPSLPVCVKLSYFCLIVKDNGRNSVDVLGRNWRNVHHVIALCKGMGGGNLFHCLADGFGGEVFTGVAELQEVFLTKAALES